MSKPVPPRHIKPRQDARARELERLLDENWRLREAAERAEAEGVDRARLLATVSHEIRTPLAGIVGMADLLVAEPLTPAQANYARAIATSGRALLAMVGDVLDISRIAADRLDLHPAPAPLLVLLEDIVELMAPRAEAKALDLALSLSTPLPATVVVDAGRLRQVLVNLIDNAVKFTATGGVCLQVAVSARRAGAVSLAFAVSDTGSGIAEADRARIFDDYVRAGTNAPEIEGAGLGLAIARAIVTAMGGRIDLDSRVGLGSTFRFALDLPVNDASTAPLPTLTGTSLLVIAGDGAARPLAQALELLGAAVDIAETTWDAAAALRHDGFDALLILHGPDDAGDRLGALGPDGPPAVVVLPVGARADLSRLAAQGFRAHLMQPVRLASLDKVLTAVLAGAPVDEPVQLQSQSDEPSWRVLLAEDDEIGALLARTLLARSGADITVVADGADAVAAAAAAHLAGRPFDLVLMDLNLSGLDGLSAIEALRSAERGRRAQIIALTADGSGPAERAALAAGADLRLVKPLTVDMLSRLAGDVAASNRSRHQKSPEPAHSHQSVEKM